MSKNPEFTKYASDPARHQDAICSASEDLIKVSQRFGHMMPKFSKLGSPAILNWSGIDNKINDRAKNTDADLAELIGNDQFAANPMLLLQVSFGILLASVMMDVNISASLSASLRWLCRAF